MKRCALVLGVLALTLSFGATAQAQNVVGSLHDLSATGPNTVTNATRVCVFCHTPHQAAAANAQDPLWNHTLSTTATYGVYASATLNATPTEVGGAAAGGAAVTNLCLSCHDGTVSVASLYNPPNETNPLTVSGGGNVLASGLITNTPNVGTSLTDDHPVNFTYNAALVTADANGGPNGLNDPTVAPVAPLLFNSTVQCASCHDPHDGTNPPFMVMSNVNSALCTTCHIK